MGLSSLDLNRGAPGPWVPSPKDKALRLTSLTIKLSEVLLSTLIDILAVCPNLLVLDLLLINTNLKRFRPLDSPTFGESYLMCMIRQACPRLRKFQYSNSYYMFYPIECMLWDMEHITERVIWIGYLKPPLGSLLLRHQNVITSLEFVDIFPKRTLYPEAGGQDLMNTGLHTFLCNAPLLRELKAILVTCSSDRLDPFPWDLKAEPRQRSNWNNTSVSREPRVWACRNLETLELHFTQSHSVTVSKAPRKLVARDVRVVFGYLSRVCPKLRKVHLGLDSARLDLQSGLCLAARLKSLEKLTIEMPGKMSRWSSGLDLSWLDPPQFQEVTTPFHQWEMRNWGPLLQQEQELVERREAFLKQDKTVAVSRGGEYRFADFSQSLALLGTLADVNNCLMQIAESKRDAQARFSWHSYMPAPRVVLIGL
ncbi:hypothetical protein BG005_007236 [Podila minutissima]|nr:hypothetical protein BG005_007236 [Podila minutissima]